jgi:uncharacterized protein (TIGR02452 family)
MNNYDANYLATIAGETISVCENGQYRNDFGDVVNISMSIKNAKDSTINIPPGVQVPGVVVVGKNPVVNNFRTKFYCVNMTAIAVAKKFRNENVCVLNFANAKKPGGNFLIGSPSQEEFICRCTALYPCIAKSPMYDYAIGKGDGEYSDYAIYSPDVPVFRDDNYSFTEEPNFCSFVTCAAPNYNDNCFSSVDHTEAMRNRVKRVLDIMACKGHTHIVLGAWGCGSFGHNPDNVARIFNDALNLGHKGVFSVVVFAIFDSSKTQNTIKSFEKFFKQQD